MPRGYVLVEIRGDLVDQLQWGRAGRNIEEYVALAARKLLGASLCGGLYGAIGAVNFRSKQQR